MSEIRLLKLEEYDLWNSFVDESKMGEIYNYSWWLEAVTNNDFKILVVFEGNEIVAGLGLPFYSIKVINCPQLTQTNGIVFSDKVLNGSLSKRFSSEKKYTNIILEFLDKKKIKVKNIKFNYNYINWQPFYWNGYKQTTNYTCIVDYKKINYDINTLIDSEKRRQLKKAREYDFKIEVDLLSAKEFYNYYSRVLEKKGKKIKYSYSFFEKLYLKTKEKNKSYIFSIHKEKIIHAAYFIVLDNKSAHYLIVSIDEEYKKFRGSTLLTYFILDYFSNKLNFFNFEGSMIEFVQEHNKTFSTDINPYIVIKEKDTIMRKIKDILILLKNKGKNK